MMGNIFDYLDWRGDITFDVDPFNEVDNLVLSWLAYTDFEGIMRNREIGSDMLGFSWPRRMQKNKLEQGSETCPDAASSKSGYSEEAKSEASGDASVPAGSENESASDALRRLFLGKREDLRRKLTEAVPEDLREKIRSSTLEAMKNGSAEKKEEIKEEKKNPEWLRRAHKQIRRMLEEVQEPCGPFEEEDELSIQEVCWRYFHLHTIEEIEARSTLYKSAPYLLIKLAASKRYANMRVRGYVNMVREEYDLQMSVMTFELGNGEYYVAYRGTDDTLVGWKEDFDLSYLDETPGQAFAKYYLNHFDSVKFRVGGHSKGGNFAVYAAAFADEKVRENAIAIYSNDGPGFVEAVADSPELMRILPKTTKIVPQASMIGILMSCHIPLKVVKSSGAGVMQHDAATWEVLGNSFMEMEERSGSSFFVDKTFKKWVEGISSAERKRFIDNFFGLFEQAGLSTLTDVNDHKLKAAYSFVKGVAGLPEDDRKQFMGIVRKLFWSGAKELVSDHEE